jgi:hypothetical protein
MRSQLSVETITNIRAIDQDRRRIARAAATVVAAARLPSPTLFEWQMRQAEGVT